MYVGLDVAKNKSNVCILDEKNKVVKEFEIVHDKNGFEQLEKELKEDVKIAMESTGNYCKALYNHLKEKYDVCFVDNIQMHNFAKLHHLHIKNDVVDARLIALYLSTEYKKVTPSKFDELKDLGRLYQHTMKEMMRYKSSFRDKINIIFPEIESHFYMRKSKGIPNLLLKYPSAELIANANVTDLRSAMTEKLKKSAKYTVEYAERIKNLAKESIGVKNYPTSFFQYNIKIIFFYEDLLDEIKISMDECLKKTPYYPLLNEWGYSINSFGSIVGEIGDIRRFPTYKHFVGYCGLNVSEKQSGKTKSLNCYITKRGNKILRSIFYTLTLVHLSSKTELSKCYYRLKENGKHSKQCLTAMARKVAIKTYFDMMKCHN